MSTATVSVWPRLGTTVTLASGYVITAAGAVATLTDEIVGLLLRYTLLTYDPTFANPNPSPIPPSVSGGVSVASPAAASSATLTNNQALTLQAAGTDGTGGGSLYFVAGDTTPVDGGLVFYHPSGRIKRVYDPNLIQADWFGIPKDGVTDCSAQLTAALNATSPSGVTQLGAGVYRVDSTNITIPQGRTLRGVTGVDGGQHNIGSSANACTVIQFGGGTQTAAGKCILAPLSGATIEKIAIQCAVGSHIRAAIGCHTPSSNSFQFNEVYVNGFNGTWGSNPGMIDYGYEFGVGSPSQCDNAEWHRGAIMHPLKGAVAYNGGQPYNMIMNHVRLSNYIGSYIQGYYNYTGSAKSGNYGTLFELITPGYGSITINGGECNQYGTLFKNFDSTVNYISVNNLEVEGFKRLFVTGAFSRAFLPVTFRSGRFDPFQYDMTVYASDGTTVEIAGTDTTMLYDAGGCSFFFDGCAIGTGGWTTLQDTLKFVLPWQSKLSMTGCTLPNLDIVSRLQVPVGTAVASTGGTYIKSCQGLRNPALSAQGANAGQTAQYQDRDGCENAPGIVTVTGTATTATVTLPKGEFGDLYGAPGNAYAPYFFIELVPVNSTGTPATGSRRAYVDPSTIVHVTVGTGQEATTSFGIVLDVAPGSGNSVSFMYKLTLNRSGIANAGLFD